MAHKLPVYGTKMAKGSKNKSKLVAECSEWRQISNGSSCKQSEVLQLKRKYKITYIWEWKSKSGPPECETLPHPQYSHS